VPAGAHANYRGRSDNHVAVLTTEFLPAAPGGSTYQAWVRHDQQWTSLGTFEPGTNGYAIVIADDVALATSPDAVQVTLEPAGGSQAPTGAVILAWSTP
jgi:anti-sigma-K factor RskA